MSDKPVLAVVGATGVVGQLVLRQLPTRDDLWGEVRLLASEHSAGRSMHALGQEVIVDALTKDALAGVDVCILAVPREVAARWAPVIAAQGTVVIDNSGAFSDHPDVPLVVPEINPQDLAHAPMGIVASPSATTLMLANTLGTLHDGWHLREAIVSTYQAVSDAGARGVRRLYDEVDALAGNRSVGQQPGDVRRFLGDLEAESPFPGPVALNVIPWIGGFGDGRWSEVEQRTRQEVRSVLQQPELRVAATCVQVPVAISHSASVHLTFERRLSRDDAVRALTEASNGVVVLDEPLRGEWPTPVDVVGADPVFVGRIRQSEDFPRSLELFVCSDNLRKGSALNMLQLAELAIGRPVDARSMAGGHQV